MLSFLFLIIALVTILFNMFVMCWFAKFFNNFVKEKFVGLNLVTLLKVIAILFLLKYFQNLRTHRGLIFIPL